jgi:hypothetical protein
MRRRPEPHVSPALPVGLLGLAEVHDLSFGSQIAPLLRLLSQEAELMPDLLRARPWLDSGLVSDADSLFSLLLDQEWTGFVAHIGRVGPWVYAPTVAALQQLSAGYTQLVGVARQSDLSGVGAASLMGRLRDAGLPQGSGRDALAAEQLFWQLAQAQAAQQKQLWAARRPP